MDFYGAFLPREFQIATYSMSKDSSTRTQKKSVSVFCICHQIQDTVSYQKRFQKCPQYLLSLAKFYP